MAFSCVLDVAAHELQTRYPCVGMYGDCKSK